MAVLDLVQRTLWPMTSRTLLASLSLPCRTWCARSFVFSTGWALRNCMPLLVPVWAACRVWLRLFYTRSE
jgi:hypothetical protein